jgi:hypothetical protein
MTLTLFVWWSISPVISKLILWEIFICHSYKYTSLLFTGLIDHHTNMVRVMVVYL